MRFIKKIKDLFNMSQRIAILETELKEIDIIIKNKVDAQIKDFRKLLKVEFKEFEAKIQKMTFDYTANLDDTKSRYLKQYVETRMNCMQQELSSIPNKIASIQGEVNKLLTKQDDDK